MENKMIQINDNSLFSIEKIGQLAIIKFKSDAPIEELYKLENTDKFFEEDLKKLSGSDITTRLFIFSNDIFSGKRFIDFFETIKKSPEKRIDFLSSDSNINNMKFARFINIKYRFIKDVLESNKLNIFALDGSSIGLWLSTVLCGNFSILSQNSQFTFPFINDGILPLGGLIYYLDKYASKAALDEVLLLGKPITADEMLSWGLVNRVFPSDSFEKKSIELALEISNKSPYYVNSIIKYKERLNKKLMESLDYERRFYADRGFSGY
jgi:hypothetical protein